MYDVNKFDYSPWYSGDGPDITTNDNEPSIRLIQEKITALDLAMNYYKEQLDIVYDSTILARTAATPAAIPAATARDNTEFLDVIKADIYRLAEEIDTLIKTVLALGSKNKTDMQGKVSTLLEKNDHLQEMYAEIMEKHEELNTLDASYRDTQTKSNSNLYIYLFYFLMVIFIFGSLLYILKNPQEGGNLDMFILVLAILIFAYYIYDYYFIKRQRN
jgi:hypothetical protein